MGFVHAVDIVIAGPPLIAVAVDLPVPFLRLREHDIGAWCRRRVYPRTTDNTLAVPEPAVKRQLSEFCHVAGTQVKTGATIG